MILQGDACVRDSQADGPITPFDDLIAQGGARAWFLIPSVIQLGALHGLEPGHSKTKMAAFIVAIRATVRQAVLPGIAATVSHIIVVWLIALAGMRLDQDLDSEAVEPHLQLRSGAIIVPLALWMICRTRRDRVTVQRHGDVRAVDTGHGIVELSIAEAGHWRFRPIADGSGRPST